MPISIPLPQDLKPNLYQVLSEILRRAVDGTVTSSSQPTRIYGSDFGTISGGSGLIIPSRSGAYFGRLLLENPDSNGNLDLSADPGPSATAGDISITGGGNGLVVYSRDGSTRGRILLEEPDSNGNMIISADPNVTFLGPNDIVIQTAGFGFLLPSRDGSRRGRIILENPDSNGNLSISVDPI